MTTRTRWITTGVAAPTALIIATIGVALALQARLPDPVATHFSGGGGADDSMPFAASQAVPLGIAFAAVVIGAALCVGAKHGFHQVRATASLVLGITALLCATDVVSLAANLDATTWHDAALVTWQFVLAILALPIAGAAGWFAFGRAPAATPTAATPPATVGLKPGERAVWTGAASSHLMIAAAALVTAALAVVAVATAHPWLFAVAAVAGIAVAVLAEIRVVVDVRGVTVRSWVPLIRLRRVPLRKIERATAIDVDPMQWGGWGYRALPGRGSAIVLHRGPGLKLDLDGGRAFVVTVGDPEIAAGLVNDLAAHS